MKNQYSPAEGAGPPTGAGLAALLEGLDRFEAYVFERTLAFLDRFARAPAFDLSEVSFSMTGVKVVYVLDCGQQVADTLSIGDFAAWMDTGPATDEELRARAGPGML